MTCSGSPANLYEQLGGDPAIESFVSRLYDIMASDAEAEYIWKWHPEDLDEVKARLKAFLSGWLGGPAVYPERYGPPMMRRRHMAFPIGPRERDIWLACARKALAETVPEGPARANLDMALTAMAEHMRNMDETGRPEASGCGCGGSCS
jgi:hemoglobin